METSLIPLSYDLHIHSCLSPCGDDDMTPCNIAGMAALIGLDVIAVTDHNTCKNCPAVMDAASQYPVTVIPGMELCTIEEVHVLCLFKQLDAAMAFDDYVYKHLIKIKNRPDIFGFQQIYNSEDAIAGEEPYLLINATDISFDNVWQLTADYGGIMIPAHVDKDSTSLLSNLGLIPQDSRFRCAEIKNRDALLALQKKHPYLEQCHLIFDSDAHRLEQIHEATQFIHCKSRSASDILAALQD
ncbi:MAG: PHP domain-containing protein [Catenibacillus sp.]